MKGNPFVRAIALKNSTLHFVQAGRLQPVDPPAHTADPFLFETYLAFQNFVRQPGFSCIGAKAALNDESLGFAIYDELSAPKSSAGLARDLFHFAQSDIATQNEFATFVAVFRGPLQIAEARFERLLWQQLSLLHDIDAAHFEWNPRVSPDPGDPQFSFSFAGRAFYVLGMHGNSSRMARRFPWPALVFNPHEQFERLRRDGKWKRMQQTIRAREVALQGSVNPMLTEFGEKSEARQYSGREVPDGWIPPASNGNGKCPFAH
jgi:FPC/CPF motif-containing protein YcgG